MPQVDRLALAVQSRALALPQSGAVVVLRAVPSPFLQLIPASRLRCEQSFRPLHDALAAAGLGVAPRAEGPAAMVVVNLTRSRAENLGNIARGLHLLPPGAALVVAGAKSEGVDSLARQVARAFPLAGAFVKAHGRVFWLARPDPLPEVVAVWARDAAPARNPDGFLTAPGMFSPERIDPGSRRLAAALAGRVAGRVADLGAGWGWLARATLERNPGIAEMDLHEAELMALEAARANVPDARARFHWSDVARLGKGAGPCDAVIMNPPFHRGRAAEPDLGAGFIAAAGRVLKPQGRLTMVANRQLPYEAALDAAFRRWTKLGEAGGYKLLEAEGPRRG
jgi:16S rRNA (guanine1207-N2)-methyltransferase